MGQLLYDSLMSVPPSEGPIQNKCNKSVGIKAKEERADVRATQRSGVVTCLHTPDGLGASISRMQWVTFKSRELQVQTDFGGLKKEGPEVLLVRLQGAWLVFVSVLSQESLWPSHRRSLVLTP